MSAVFTLIGPVMVAVGLYLGYRHAKANREQPDTQRRFNRDDP
jgi:hypothetical protein